MKTGIIPMRRRSSGVTLSLLQSVQGFFAEERTLLRALLHVFQQVRAGVIFLFPCGASDHGGEGFPDVQFGGLQFFVGIQFEGNGLCCHA